MDVFQSVTKVSNGVLFAVYVVASYANLDRRRHVLGLNFACRFVILLIGHGTPAGAGASGQINRGKLADQ